MINVSTQQRSSPIIISESSESKSLEQEIREGDYHIDNEQTIPGVDRMPDHIDPSIDALFPVAVVSDVVEGTELIVNGIVVEENGGSRSIRRSKHEMLLTIIIILGMIICATIMIIRSKNDIPSQLRDILIPIFGDEKLQDDTTAQYYCFNFLTQRIFEQKVYREFLKEDDLIIERYVTCVIPFSVMSIRQFDFRRAPEEICDVFDCNDEGEISTVAIRNNWNNVFGGGTIAEEVGVLTGLENLVLSRNALNGTIPTEIGKLEKLRTLDLSSNLLTGTIPTEIGQLTNLELLLLDGNLLHGEIPSELSKLENLLFVDLSENSFSGEIPTEMSLMKNLKGLSLYENNLSGNVSFFCKKNFTNELFVREMNLKGLMLAYSYNYAANLSLTVDCKDHIPILDCHCCTCYPW